MPPHGKGLPSIRKTVRCKFFNDDGQPIPPGCNRSAESCIFVHPEEREWGVAEKRSNARGGEMHSRGRRFSDTSNHRGNRPCSRSRSPGSRSPSPGHRSRLPGSSRRRSPSPRPRRRDRSRSPPRAYQSRREYGTTRASSPSHSSAPAQTQPGPSRPFAPQSPRERTASRSDAMPAALRPLPPRPPPHLYKIPQPPPQMVGNRELTDTEKVDVWDKRITLAADALNLRRESNELLEDIQQAEALSNSSAQAAEEALRLVQRKSQKDAELLKKIDALNRERFWPIAKDVDADKLQKDFEGMGEKAGEVQAKLAEFSELLRDVMRKEAQLKGGVESDGSGRARKRRRIGVNEDGEVDSDDDETAREKAMIVEAEKHLEELYTGIRVQLDDLKELVAQEARDAKEEVMAKIDDSVAEILAEDGGEAGGVAFRAEPGPLAMARLEREESRHKALENYLQVLREEHEELIRLKDAKIAEQEVEITQLRALLDEVTLGYERDQAETEALVAASTTHAAVLQQRLLNLPPVAPIPDATTILDSLPTSLDELVMSKLQPLLLAAHESTRNTLEAHSRTVQEKVVSTVIEGARVAHVLVNYLNTKDHAGLQAVLESMTAQAQDGPRNGMRPIQPPPPRQERQPPRSASASMQPPPRPVSSISVPQKMPDPGSVNGWTPSVSHQVPASPPDPQHQYPQWATQQQSQGLGTPSGQTQTAATRANQMAYYQAKFVQGHASVDGAHAGGSA